MPAAHPPSPDGVRTLDELVARLRRLRAWSGLSYHEVHRRVADLRQPRRIPERLVYNTVYRCFQPGRSRLDVELVVDIARVLLGDDALATQWRAAYQVVTGRTTEAEIVSVSWRLPDDPGGFTGRRRELELLLAPDAAPVIAITGMAGVGKTRLATTASRLLLRSKPEGDLRLWVNLRGHDPDRPPADPSAVLGAVLRGLGVPGDQIYHLDLPARAARYRELLAGRRGVIVLDNAAGEDQVRPLLPAPPPDKPGCRVLITSRRALPGVPALRLDVFSPEEAADVLHRAAGAARVEAEPDAAAGIARLAGYLPLALALIAARIERSPGWTLADHLSRLAERTRHRRLDGAVELALDASYGVLPEDRRRLLRLLALHPGSDLDGCAAAALIDATVEQAQRNLDELVAANLLYQEATGRYGMHDLVRLYAAARAVDDEPASARQAAITRLFDHYLRAAMAATDALYPGRRGRRWRLEPAAIPMPPVTDPLAWLDAERPNLLASIAWAAAHGRPAHAHRLAGTLACHLDIGGHHAEAIRVHQHALDAARAAGDRDGEATALGNLGLVCWRVARNDEAIEHGEGALHAFRELGDREAMALALCNLGLVHERIGRYRQATDHYQRALDGFREAGRPGGEAAALTNLAVLHAQLGHDERAVQLNQRALEIRREQGDRPGEVLVLCNLGGLFSRAGRHAEAMEHHRAALAIAVEIGFRHGEAYALTSLGVAEQRLGRTGEAIAHHERALTLAASLGDAEVEATVRNNLGQALLAGGRHRDARDQHELALALARDAGVVYELARSHDLLAHALDAGGDPGRAREHWRGALAGYDRLDVPDATAVRAHLDRLDAVARAVG
jgi:tetratricopeptide (TPR) repeat protein